jgi:hypothetical protein
MLIDGLCGRPKSEAIPVGAEIQGPSPHSIDGKKQALLREIDECQRKSPADFLEDLGPVPLESLGDGFAATQLMLDLGYL